MIKYNGEELVDGAYYTITYTHEYLDQPQEVVALKHDDHWFFTMLDEAGSPIAAGYEHDDKVTVHWRVPTVEEVNDVNDGGA